MGSTGPVDPEIDTITLSVNIELATSTFCSALRAAALAAGMPCPRQRALLNTFSDPGDVGHG